MKSTDPVRPADDEARKLARKLLSAARHGALAVLNPDTGSPHVTRIALTGGPGVPVTPISDLAAHTAALRANPAASLMVGEPGDKGDPLTHPRLTLDLRAEFVARGSEEDRALRTAHAAASPKSKLWIGFADFNMVRLVPLAGFLNGGFGKAFTLTPADLGIRPNDRP